MGDLADSIWSAMRDGELYSPADLANRLNQTVATVIPILDFLARWGFAVRLSRHEQLFVKRARAPSPSNVAKICQAILEDNQIARH